MDTNEKIKARARSNARYWNAAGVLPKMTLGEAEEAARYLVITHTGEKTTELVRRLLLDEARRVARRAQRA